MTEVIGHLLVFAIVTILMVISMVSFHASEKDASKRVESLEASSAAGRVSGLLVKAALLAEKQGTTAEARFRVDLPQSFEGRAYTVALQAAASGQPARVQVTVAADAITVYASLFAADAPSTVPVCATSVAGGALNARYGPNPAGSGPACLFLETTR